MERPRTLDINQKYLLDRLPGRYDLKRDKEPEPKEVRQARVVVANWDRKQALMECKFNKQVTALLNKAREVIYFEEPKKALQIVRQVEKMCNRKCQI